MRLVGSGYAAIHSRSTRLELLQAIPSNPSNGGASPVSWSYDRPDGGRSFVWGGSDFHDNMHSVIDYRRYLLNAIAWTAKLDVPKNGIATKTPTNEDLDRLYEDGLRMTK